MVLRRIFAAVMLGVLFIVFRAAAREHGRNPWKWFGAGAAAFYGTAIVVSALSSLFLLWFARIRGTTPGVEQLPAYLGLAFALGLVSATLAARAMLRRLQTRAMGAPPPDESRVRPLWLWLYIASFVILAVASWLDPDASETAIELAVDAVLTTLNVAGMTLYVRRVVNPRLVQLWTFVAPILPIATVIQVIIDAHELASPNPDITGNEHGAIVSFVMIVLAAYMTPSFVMNLRFARGRVARPPSLRNADASA